MLTGSRILMAARATAGRLLFALLTACGTAGELSGQEHDTFFYSRNQRVRVTIVRDTVVALLQPAVTPAQINQAAKSSGLKVARTLPDGARLLVERPSSLPSVEAEAFVWSERAAEVVRERGLMVLVEGARSPLYMNRELLVQFVPTASPQQVESLLTKYALEVIPTPSLNQNQFVVQVPGDSPEEVLATANALHEHGLVEHAQPNFIVLVESRSGPGRPAIIPNDSLFGHQWHLHNTGDAAGTVDADIDAPEAWSLTLGSPDAIIAIIDDGFDMTHPDLALNLWVNAGDSTRNGVDDDRNGHIDDRNGWDVQGNDNDPSPGLTNDHGTPAAGAAAAVGNNGIGVSGSCPGCRLMLIRLGSEQVHKIAQAFNYARRNGASVISNSWGYEAGPATLQAQIAIDSAAAGAVVMFAMATTGEGYKENCTGRTSDISALPSVVAVSGLSNADARTPSGYGDCMEVLGPADSLGTGGKGTLYGISTDRQGDVGLNHASTTLEDCPSPTSAPPPETIRNYTVCFSGTSFATPVVAGVAGLVLSAHPGLTPAQVRRLLNDTADKVQDSLGQYDPRTGFSAPTVAPGQAGVVGSTHGFGRVNAFEAVRTVAPVDSGGRGGVDAFIRDNRLDWGNTEQPSSTLMEPIRGLIDHWTSPDIKVDRPPYRTGPTAADFDTFMDEAPELAPGGVNRVYVRVRNRGPLASGSATVRLLWAAHATLPPHLPADFWTAFPASSRDPATPWKALACFNGASTCEISSIPYSGSSAVVAGTDSAQIVRFDFPAPDIDPTLSQITLLALVDAPPDRPLPLARPMDPRDLDVEWLTPNDNNVAQRRYTDLRIGGPR